MWTRKELKRQAKEALQRNYWRIILVTLLLLVLGNSNILGNTSTSAAGSMRAAVVDETPAEEDTLKDAMMDEASLMKAAEVSIGTLSTSVDKLTVDMGRLGMIITTVIFLTICFMIAFAIFIIVIAFVTFLVNPVIVGAQRFMLKSVDGRAEVKETAYAFDHSYKNIVKVMFHTQFSIFLWAFLLIIPGLYKKYQYRMVEYIIAEHPDMHYKDAMRLSTEMMNGEKWHAFVLDLSFIPWEMLSLLTCGLAYVLFVAPYQYLTNAALYRKLCALRSERYRSVYEEERKHGTER